MQSHFHVSIINNQHSRRMAQSEGRGNEGGCWMVTTDERPENTEKCMSGCIDAYVCMRMCVCVCRVIPATRGRARSILSVWK